MEQQQPLVLVNSGEDSDFYYATRFLTHDPALYISFGKGDDMLVLNILGLERRQQTSAAKKVVDRADHGWEEDPDIYRSWAQLAARLPKERGIDRIRVSAKLEAGYPQEPRAQARPPPVQQPRSVPNAAPANPPESRRHHGPPCL